MSVGLVLTHRPDAFFIACRSAGRKYAFVFFVPTGARRGCFEWFASRSTRPTPLPAAHALSPLCRGAGRKVRPHAARSIRSVQAAVPAVKTSDRQGKEVTRTAGMRACNFAPTLPALHAACFAVAAPRAPAVRKMPLSRALQPRPLYWGARKARASSGLFLCW